jgi:hypothetical protein
MQNEIKSKGKISSLIFRHCASYKLLFKFVNRGTECRKTIIAQKFCWGGTFKTIDYNSE